VEDGTNRGFWLERSAERQDHWQRLGWVPAAETTIAASYAYFDEDVQQGQRYYYRLYQEDYDAGFSYSPIVSALLAPSMDLDFQLFPNPGRERLSLVFDSRVSSGGQLSITDAFGRHLRNQYVAGSIELNTEHWPAGCYYLSINTENNFFTKKWIKL
jgi:hypothetical protein